MAVYHIEYYTEPNGRQPVIEWLARLDMKANALIRDKIDLLAEYGLMLLRTNMVKRIVDGEEFL